MAEILAAPVCSLYLVEGDGHELVMRGNVGFSQTALGQVRLTIGQGMTGQAVEEYLRPISSANATAHDAYKHFEDLGEERFPSTWRVPITGKGGPLGAVVVQRAEAAFEDRDVELCVALGAIISAGIRHAELIDARRDRPASHARRAGADAGRSR